MKTRGMASDGYRTGRRLVASVRLRILTAAILPLVLLLAACGSDQEPETAADAPADDDGEEVAADTCDTVDLGQAPESPVPIDIGIGFGASEPLLIHFEDPESFGADHAGAWYELTLIPFPNPADRLSAYQAGELTGATMSYPQGFLAVSAGLDIALVASLDLIDGDADVRYPYFALEESGIRTPEDLEGARIGVIAPNNSTEYWAKSAVANAGLDPDRDVEYVYIPTPNLEEALRQGQVDVSLIINDFLPAIDDIDQPGGIVEIFDAFTATGFTHENLDIFLDRGFIADNLGAACAFLEDFQAAMLFYVESPEEAGAVLAASELDPATSPDDILERPDSGRAVDARVDLANLVRLNDELVRFGVLPEDQAIDDIEEMTYPGVSLVR